MRDGRSVGPGAWRQALTAVQNRASRVILTRAVTPPLSVIIPFSPDTAGAASRLAQAVAAQASQVLLAGQGAVEAPGARSVQVLQGYAGKGAAVRAALEQVQAPITVLQEPDAAYPTEGYAALAQPIAEDKADAVFAQRRGRGAGPALLAERALGGLARLVAEVGLTDPLTGQRAVRTQVLRELALAREDEAVDVELVVKLAERLYRLEEVPLELMGELHSPWGANLSRLRLLWEQARQQSAPGRLEGYITLERMEGASNYNAWLGQRFREHMGRRVLEVGAGIGTITRELEGGAELLVALEVEEFYVERLRNRFRGKPHVRPYLSDVALADWEALQAERLDTIVLSNVLEHIPDDGGAVRRFGQILQPGGRLLVLVPALPQIFGALDEAVGHHRRYTPDMLRAVLEGNGFAVERLEWVNLLGIPGWYVNSRLLRRRAMPKLQLALYDRLAPLLARAERHVELPVGMSLFAVARTTGGVG